MILKQSWPLRLASIAVSAILSLPALALRLQHDRCRGERRSVRWDRMSVAGVQSACNLLLALAALALVGCGSSDSDGGPDDDEIVFTPVTVASVGAFQGELATLADEQFTRTRLTGNTDVDLPIVLDGSDIGAIGEAQWLSIKSAYREGWPVVLLQPTREQIDAVIANLRIDLDAPEELAGLDAIGFQSTAVGDIEAVFEYINTDARPDPDVRVAAIGEWVAERQALHLAGAEASGSEGRAPGARRRPRASRRGAGVGSCDGVVVPTGVAGCGPRHARARVRCVGRP